MKIINFIIEAIKDQLSDAWIYVFAISIVTITASNTFSFLKIKNLAFENAGTGVAGLDTLEQTPTIIVAPCIENVIDFYCYLACMWIII